MTKKQYSELYRERRLGEGYPDLAELLAEHACSARTTGSRVPEILACLDRVVDIRREPRTAAVVGCGARPWAIRDLSERGFSVVGIEPEESSRRSAGEFLAGAAPVLDGVGEDLPLEDSSQGLVILESVLEHVDSVDAVLSECYRVLRGDGVLYIVTTNRHRFHPLGRNWEFRVPFYNWFPVSVKESYVYKQLHFQPRLANYAARPAVNWFTYAELCRLGRRAGFSRFYHKLDLVGADPAGGRLGPLKRRLLSACRVQPWLRALLISQLGTTIHMLKRARR